MQARTLTPAAIFGHHVRYVVPLFQRPYVWNEQDQWAPLWSDVRNVAEQLLTSPSGFGLAPVAPHFLGAIVLDQPHTPSGYIAVRHVIDGQQRLTTLQIFLNAAQRVAEQHGAKMDAQALRILVRNESAIAQQPYEVFKVWPTDRDQQAFQAAMDNDAGPPSPAPAAVASAHGYFVRQIETWAGVTGDPDKAAARIQALTQVLRDYLKIVVIDLEPGDNAQVIFETLNHRGAPLLAADLIKNLVFQVALAQGLDVAGLYQRQWQKLDSDHWREKIARGRQYVPRIDIFVNYWLVTRLIREVPADRIFVVFRDQVVGKQPPNIESLLTELARDANIYASLDSWPAESAVGRFRYRVIQAMDSAVVTPVLLWLLRWPPEVLPTDQRDKALGALESWLVRRSICRLTSKDINRLVLDLLRELDTAGPAAVGDVTERFLLTQTADSRFWPTDDQVVEALQSTPIYKALLRARLRMLIEAIEDKRRSGKSEEGFCPRNLTVEHLMPRAWREHWAAGIGTTDAERDLLIHTLGNLTLVNNKLNPALSNRPWTDKEAQARGLGTTGKRSELLEHSTLKINADLIAAAPDEWSDEQIHARTLELAQVILEIWPLPVGGVIAQMALATAEREPAPASEDSLAEPDSDGYRVGKYQPLTDWLRAQTVDALPMGFEDLEDILGARLPPSARNHPPYWYSATNSLGKAIAAAGFKASGANLTSERVILMRR